MPGPFIRFDNMFNACPKSSYSHRSISIILLVAFSSQPNFMNYQKLTFGEEMVTNLVLERGGHKLGNLEKLIFLFVITYKLKIQFRIAIFGETYQEQWKEMVKVKNIEQAWADGHKDPTQLTMENTPRGS